jgi:leucyl aminopeptidase
VKITLDTTTGKNKDELIVAILDSDDSISASSDGRWQKEIAAASDAFRKKTVQREILRTFPLDSKTGPKAFVAYSTSHVKSFDSLEAAKIFAARSLGLASDYGYKRIRFLIAGDDGARYVGPLVEGLVVGAYRFDKYRKPNDKKKGAATATLEVRKKDHAAAKSALTRYRVVSNEVNRARDLVNEPGDRVVPKTLADTAKAIARSGKLEVTVVSGAQLEKMGYRGLIAVGKGSIYPPRLIVLRYRPAKKSKRHLALVGKGITFDTGGISIKPSEGMWSMKGDMAGGAAVLGAMAAIAALRPKVAVTGIVAAAENFPGPKSQRPGDIFVAKNGKSVMVDNTDAEGRLVLTDALARAGEEGATHIVDAATLTGSCVRALGTSVAAVMGNDKELVKAVIESGARHGEVFWELPLVEEYRESLKTPYADLNNIGGKNAGAITAGLFLEEFVPEGAKWVHLDIAGPFIMEKKWKYFPEGATGFGVKTLVDLAERFDQL